MRLEIQEGSFAWLVIDVAVIRESDGIPTRMSSCDLSIWLGVLKPSGIVLRGRIEKTSTPRGRSQEL